ncbi:MAG TPA: hypothetical protein VFF72_07680, partial [Caldimonas sp.]|nr:hypothetical protein [Caldimonas sp.]
MTPNASESGQDDDPSPPDESFALPVPDLAHWRGGNAGVEGVWSFDGRDAGAEVLVTALVHGNELCGA